RMELERLRHQASEFWVGTGASLKDSVYLDLQNLIDSSDRLAEKLSPARLYFVHRWWRKITKSDHQCWFLDPLDEFEHGMTTVADKRILEALVRLKLDLVMKLGVFLVAGSISGWISLFYLESRILWRSRIWPAGDRVDRFMDFNERLVTR